MCPRLRSVSGVAALRAIALLAYLIQPGDSQEFFGCEGYQFSTFKATWENARNICQSQGYGDLVALDDVGEYEYVRHLFKKLTPTRKDFVPFWTSGSSNNSLGLFAWHSSGVLFKHTPNILQHFKNTALLIHVYMKYASYNVTPAAYNAAADMGSDEGLHLYQGGERFFICEKQTFECRIDDSVDVGSGLESRGGGKSDSNNDATDCYIISKCKASQLIAQRACYQRYNGDLLSIESKEEFDYVLGLLQRVRRDRFGEGKDLYWTGGVRFGEIVWETTNETLFQADMPEDFESYFTYQHKTLGLAYRLVPRLAGNWAFMNPTQDLRFICERQTVQCGNLTGKTNKLPHNLATHHTKQKRDSKFTGALKAATPKFSRLQHGNKSYVLYHETIHPDNHMDFCLSYNWTAFTMDTAEERASIWKKILAMVPNNGPNVTINVLVCTAGVIHTSYKWLATAEYKIEYRPPAIQWDVPTRRLFLHDNHDSSKNYFYGWRAESLDDEPANECLPACETE